MAIYVGEENILISDRLLLTMHNLCAVRPEIARTGDELSRIIHITVDNVLHILNGFEDEGYVKSLHDHQGKKRFYLTGMGILRVCSSFT